MNKLYIISCDERETYLKFLNIFNQAINNRPSIKNVDNEHKNIRINYSSIDYYLLLENKIKNLIINHNDLSIKNLLNKATNEINNILHKYNIDYALIEYFIANKTFSNNGIIFIRVNDIKTINKLKRKYKRNNYYTLRIEKQGIINNKNKYFNKIKEYKFDNKIIYISDSNFDKQVKRYISKILLSFFIRLTNINN